MVLGRRWWSCSDDASGRPMRTRLARVIMTGAAYDQPFAGRTSDMRVTERRRGGAISRTVVTAAAVIVGLVLIGALNLFDLIPNPFHHTTTDRSQPVLLQRLSDISEYKAATAELQVLIDVEDGIDFVPSFIAGQRVTFLAGGTVDASIDFSDLGGSAVKVDGDSVTITLPA